MRIPLEKIYERFDSSPQLVKELAGSDQLSELLEIIIKKHSLEKERALELGYLVNYTLLGFIETKAFQDEVKKDLRLSSETAQSLSNDVSMQIFSLVKSDLVQSSAHQQKTEPSSLQKSNTVEKQSEIVRPPYQKEAPLIEHIKAFEERKKQKREEAKVAVNDSPDTSPDVFIKNKRKEGEPPENLPTKQEAKIDKVGLPLADVALSTPQRLQTNLVEEEKLVENMEGRKTRPSGPDPYREPIE